MSYNKQRLAELFKCIYEHTTDIIKDTEKYRRLKILGGAGTVVQFTTEHGTFTGKTSDDAGKTLRIFDEGVDAIDLFIEEFQKDAIIKTHVNRNGIIKQIEDVLRHNYETVICDNTGAFVKEAIIKPIRDNIRTWNVYVPLVNIKIEKELTLGDVSLISKDIASKATNKFMSQGDYRFHGETEEEKQCNRTACLEQISQALDAYQAFAKVKCQSHSSHIKSVATNKAFMAINSIRAFLHMLHPVSSRALWGLPREITSGLLCIVALDESEKHSFNLCYDKCGPILNFVLGAKSIEMLEKQCHLKIIQKILAKLDTERTCLENVIVAALQAIGKAIVAPTTDMRFIGYIMALERLLIRDGEESTTDKFTDRLVLALTNDQDVRVRLVKRSKELYNKRSRMVHAASFINIFEEDESDAEDWALNLAIMVLGKCKQGYTHNKLCDEINSKKYAGK